MGNLCSRCQADRRIRRGKSRWRSAVDTLISCGLHTVSRTTKMGIEIELERLLVESTGPGQVGGDQRDAGNARVVNHVGWLLDLICATIRHFGGSGWSRRRP